MSSAVELQQILGTDKRNPCFTICRDEESGRLHVYYGGEMFEQVADDRNDPQYKMMVARLYNAGVNAVKLKEAFGADRKTMQCWGDALKSGDGERLVRVLAGRQGHRKLTPEIRAYVRMRFPVILRESPWSYSKRMRAEIAEVYGQSLCAETLRPVFKELKAQMDGGTGKESGKRETDCEWESESEGLDEEAIEVLPPIAGETGVPEGSVVRQQSPVFGDSSEGGVRFVHHLGVLMFSSVLVKVAGLMGEDGWMVTQWLAALFLGAVNIEQSKLLDFEGLEAMLGRTLRSRGPQRLELGALACRETAEPLLVLNAREVDAQSYSDFYYDPHEKHCTTKKLKILKGWCGSRHFVDKVLHMDFIHTCAGHPVYIAYSDNYEDLRERFAQRVKAFRTLLSIDEQRVLTFVLDRGIYGREMFRRIVDDEHLHIVTWEKDYRTGAWDESEVKGAFVLERPRNRAEDIKKYSFAYMDQDWEKDPAMRLLRVRASNPNGRTIELGILCDDRKRPAEDLISLMFKRWIQENDFKYLDKHFGINQITSYASVSYNKLRDQVEDKQMKNGEYKALEQQRRKLRADLKRALLHEHQHPGKSATRRRKIEALTLQDESLTQRIQHTQKEVSRLDYLIQEQYRRLDVSSKKVMDALKLIARNAFYKALQPFRQKYNNYRDDHALFRNLTRAHGLMIAGHEQVQAQLFPTAHHPPARRAIVEDLLAKLTADRLRMPDGSGRRITFMLGEKAGIELANSDLTLPRNY